MQLYKGTKYDLPFIFYNSLHKLLATVMLQSSSYRVRINCTLTMQFQLPRNGIETKLFHDR